MTSFFQTHLLQEIKTYFSTLQDDGLIFSYDFKTTFSRTGVNFTLQQVETGFSLTILLEEKDEALFVKSFTLINNISLEDHSLSLYDAAMVEIALQALTFLYFIAESQDVEEVSFILPKDEAEHLSSFERFFDANLVLQTSPHAYDTFVNYTEILKAKIKCELWQRQSHDYYLRNYLQNRQKGQLFFLCDPVQKQPQPSNIIAFPVGTVFERTI